MNADAIWEFLRREPFLPFVIRISNGETHEYDSRMPAGHGCRDR